jgi:Flp pilus assembly protein TadD
VLDLAPDWIEAHINLGVALYQMGQAEQARVAFAKAVELDPNNAISQYNLGCVLEEMGKLEEAVEHLTAAEKAMPSNADVHFNLALAYEKQGHRELARAQWLLYLRYAPNGPWAAQARAHLKLCTPRKPSAPIPFRKKG